MISNYSDSDLFDNHLNELKLSKRTISNFNEEDYKRNQPSTFKKQKQILFSISIINIILILLLTVLFIVLLSLTLIILKDGYVAQKQEVYQKYIEAMETNKPLTIEESREFIRQQHNLLSENRSFLEKQQKITIGFLSFFWVV